MNNATSVQCSLFLFGLVCAGTEPESYEFKVKCSATALSSIPVLFPRPNSWYYDHDPEEK